MSSRVRCASGLAALNEATARPDGSHAAPLAFEMSYGRERIIVNCGSHPTNPEWQDMLPDAGVLPEDATMISRDRNARSAWLAEALSRLSDREKMIIHERRLVEEGVTLESLGQKLGVSKERVRQIEHQALQKLRSALTRMVGDPEASGLIPSI